MSINFPLVFCDGVFTRRTARRRATPFAPVFCFGRRYSASGPPARDFRRAIQVVKEHLAADLARRLSGEAVTNFHTYLPVKISFLSAKKLRGAPRARTQCPIEGPDRLLPPQ